MQVQPPHALEFARPLTEGVVLSTLTLSAPAINGDDAAAAYAFKIKTTAPKVYCVRPNAGLVVAGSSASIQVLLQPMQTEPAADFKCRDKFLIQSFPVAAADVGRLQAAVSQAHSNDAQAAAGGDDVPVVSSNADIWTLAQQSRADPSAPMTECKLRVVYSAPVDAAASTTATDDSHEIVVSAPKSGGSATSVKKTVSFTQPQPAADSSMATTTADACTSANSPPPAASMSSDASTAELAEARAENKRLQQMCDKYQRELLSVRSEQRQRHTAASNTTSSASGTASKLQNSMHGMDKTPANDVRMLIIVALLAFVLGAWLF